VIPLNILSAAIIWIPLPDPNGTDPNVDDPNAILWVDGATGNDERGDGRTLKSAYKTLFKSGLLWTDAVKKVQKDLLPSERVSQMLEFCDKSERGLIR